jgi:hypothetical protein
LTKVRLRLAARFLQRPASCDFASHVCNQARPALAASSRSALLFHSLPSASAAAVEAAEGDHSRIDPKNRKK